VDHGMNREELRVDRCALRGAGGRRVARRGRVVPAGPSSASEMMNTSPFFTSNRRRCPPAQSHRAFNMNAREASSSHPVTLRGQTAMDAVLAMGHRGRVPDRRTVADIAVLVTAAPSGSSLGS